jgi:hypothetical protein
MTAMDYEPNSLRALAGKLESDEMKIQNSFYLSSEFYFPSGDDFMLDTSYTGEDEMPLRDPSDYTLELSRAFFSACENGNDLLIELNKLRFGIANSIDRMNANHAHTEGKNTDEIGTLYKTLD